MAPDDGPEAEGVDAPDGDATEAGDGDAVRSRVDTIPDAAKEPASSGTEDVPVTVGSSPGEEAALRRARAVSNLLDDSIRVPGTDFRFGLDPVLGVLSGYGDAVSAAISLYPVFEAYRLDAPRRTLAKMVALVAIDFAAGSIPIVGTLFDAVWKANEWNVRSLERHLENA